jgi:spore germination cell wall hydrolase CwlJ-like protein
MVVLMTLCSLAAVPLPAQSESLIPNNLPEAVESSNITSKMQERELACLAKNIYYEAGAESFEGKIAVAQVTINRVNSGKFPSDVCRTVYQKNVSGEKVTCEFSWHCNHVLKNRPIHWPTYNESMIAAKKVLLEGFRLPRLEKALFFHAARINPNWNRKRIAKIGQHVFY